MSTDDGGMREGGSNHSILTPRVRKRVGERLRVGEITGAAYEQALLFKSCVCVCVCLELSLLSDSSNLIQCPKSKSKMSSVYIEDFGYNNLGSRPLPHNSSLYMLVSHGTV